ncbi:MAG: hypothetical protein R3B84_18680 [Zavarzinella sp.]
MVAERKQLFPLGQVVATQQCVGELERSGETPLQFIQQHATGNWGLVCEEDRQANEDALRNNERLLSVYKTKLGVKLYCITEWDRSVTTLLCSHEY